MESGKLRKSSHTHPHDRTFESCDQTQHFHWTILSCDHKCTFDRADCFNPLRAVEESLCSYAGSYIVSYFYQVNPLEVILKNLLPV